MSCCPSTWKGRVLLSPQADLGSDLWPEGREAVSSGIELWSLLPWQIRVFISMEPLTCSSPSSPTPPRPGSAPRCSVIGLLLSCRSLFQTESQSGGPDDTCHSPSTNAGKCRGRNPCSRGRDTETDPRTESGASGVIPCFHFSLQTQSFVHLHLIKRTGKVRHDL